MLYYCVNTDYGKILFGKGTRLTVDSKKVEPPAFYKFNDYCLATDFTQHNAVNETLKNVTPVRYSGKDYYSSFSFSGSENCRETNCMSGSSSQNDNFETDEKTNYMSLGLYWLRILFLKTVVFNVLMTFKAWMS
ncbi:M1-specific T cell receptor alpha chain-like [Cyprinus carpio]|uniref:M1-specific T cell receptor alpha chain-like n=1 Tax=Cyprinus carpio TaxID=7962 RepID=UPI001C5A1DF4|nr:M1-specific T cell receptor alpha chain-like [Cyprinus carpio]